MIVVIVALRNWRMTIVMLCVVPTTLAITFACLYALGLSINIMTLGGIAAAVGLIIDDSVVMIENIFSRTAETSYVKDEFYGSSGSFHPRPYAGDSWIDRQHHRYSHSAGISRRSDGSIFCISIDYHGLAMLLSFFFSITLAPLLVTFLLKPSDRTREEHREQMLETTASRMDGCSPGCLRIAGRPSRRHF